MNIPDLPGEVWLPIPGERDWYRASNLGRVKTLPHTHDYANGIKHWHPGKLLEPRLAGRYYSVELGKGRVKRVHRLVAAAFIGPLPDGLQVNHMNGDRFDNRAANLEYVTGSENMQHAYATGLQKPVHGERHGNATITSEQALYIHRMKGRMTQKALADEVGCSESVVTGIHCGKRWQRTIRAAEANAA